MDIRQLKYLITLITLPGLLSGQDDSYLRCIEANTTNNQTILHWVPPVDENDFVSYTIYFKPTTPGTFTDLTNIDDYDVNSFIHTYVNGSASDFEYYLETATSSSGVISDTLKVMDLSIQDPGTGTILLSWTQQHQPEIPSWEGIYNIWIEFPPGNWQQIGSTSELHYEYEVSICNDSLTFYVGSPDGSGCSSASVMKGGRFTDITKPPMPVIDSVSVNPITNRAVVGWEPNPAPDTEGYLVYRYINNNWIIIDTVWGRFNTTYSDGTSYPCSKSESYALAAFDSCSNKSLGTFLEPQNTLIIESYDYNPCDLTLGLSWNAYQNMQGDLSGYRILSSRDGGPFIIAGTTASGTTNFTVQGLLPESDYRFLIRAYNSASQVTSSTCFLEIYTRRYNQPAFNYLVNASVVDNSYLQLTCFVDTSASISSLQLRRYDEVSSQFVDVGTIEPVESDICIYDDLTVFPQQQSYTYDILVVDSCGKRILQSNSFSTIHLTAKLLGTDRVQLEWTPVEGLAGGVSGYELYRRTDGQTGDVPLIILPGYTTSYEDNIAALLNNSDQFTYLVAAREGNGNPWGFHEKVWSNEAMAEDIPKLFFPNAFRPGGINRVFKPVGIFINQQEYHLRIYNRWGKEVFESEAFSRGWDGTYEGNPAPAGVYVYVVTYLDAKDRSFEEKGTFVLVR